MTKESLKIMFEYMDKYDEFIKEGPFRRVSKNLQSLLHDLCTASELMEKMLKNYEECDETQKEVHLEVMEDMAELFPVLKAIYEVNDKEITNKLEDYPTDQNVINEQLYMSSVMGLFNELEN